MLIPTAQPLTKYNIEFFIIVIFLIDIFTDILDTDITIICAS